MTKEDLEGALVDVRRVVVKDEIGRLRHLGGGEASIWRAGLNEVYIVKAYKDAAEGHAEPEFNKLQELRSSSYVPKVYGLGRLVEDDGVEHAAIIEECIHGESLEQIIADGKPTGGMRDQRINAMDTALIVLELTKGLLELKSVDLAHRDISNGNVLLTDTCVEEHFANGVGLRLMDFGTSTEVSRPDVSILGPAVRLATIPFGAPEMFGGDFYNSTPLSGDLIMAGRNSSSTDVWSIGAITVFLMWGEYWPEEIADIRQRKNSGGFIINSVDAQRIAKAKKTPIDLSILIKQKRAVTKRDVELADFVQSCTMYTPSLRPSLGKVKVTLVEMLDSGRNRRTKTPSAPLRQR